MRDCKKKRLEISKKIIEAMSQKERMVHKFLEERYREEREQNKTYSVNETEYKGCYGVPEITWNDIFIKFKLDHTELSAFFSQDLSERDRRVKNHASLNGESDCYNPYNVVEPLILNDFMNASLAPIVNLDLNKFVDKDSGLEKETFFWSCDLSFEWKYLQYEAH